jgi:hypothetical protein
MGRLPLRPPISAPERPPAPGQPRLGLLGLWLVLPIAILFAVAAGGPEDSVRVLGPIIVYSLTLVVMIAFWWEDWPGTRLGPNWSGWADTVLIAAGGIVLTGAGQAIAGGLDLRGMFVAHPGPGHVPTFPATLAVGGAAFTVMLQLTLVGEGWPLRRLPATVAGPLALVVSWAIALVLYFALVKINPPPGSGITPRSGPVASADFGAALVWLGAWQVLFFVVWRGWPTSRLSSRAARLPAAHALVIGSALVTLLLVRLVLEPATVIAAGGCFVAAGLAIGMLLETGGAVAALVLAAVLFGILWVLAGAFGVEHDDWVTHAALNAIAVSIILHVGVGRRWPFRSVNPIGR